MSFKTDDGAWFEVVPGKPKEGRVKFRILNLKQGEAIAEATEKMAVEYHEKKNGDLQRFEVVIKDEKLASEMQIDFIILEWENIKLDGKELKCTKHNKLLLSKGNSSFLALQARSIRKLNKDHLALFGTEGEMGN